MQQWCVCVVVGDVFLADVNWIWCWWVVWMRLDAFGNGCNQHEPSKRDKQNDAYIAVGSTVAQRQHRGYLSS